MEERTDLGKSKVQNIVRKIKKESEETRKEISEKNRKAIEFKSKKWGGTEIKKGKMDLKDPKLKEYSGLSVFQGKYEETSVVDGESGVNVLGGLKMSKEELAVLNNNPKMAVVSKYE